ncbi:type II toxin-antitoxin system HicB family antitoxin [Archaeoglobus neptunius]|uniref:type II toxin-antitoxin system HicB family antitoxin n=1 Tax=Archaeoglobus neptunius TaxID=2798580 RepID=UPI0019279FB1|nr:type II toxin-antitoxin system HicB family antitoxin [Archaeoglobus neptunius]
MKIIKFRVMDEDGMFVVQCPALPGCISQGRTKEEALGNYLESLSMAKPVPEIEEWK